MFYRREDGVGERGNVGYEQERGRNRAQDTGGEG